MLVGHKGLPFIHNSWKCQLDGAHVGELALKAPMDVHFVIGIPPSNHVVGKRHTFSIDELERKGWLDNVFFGRSRMCFGGGFHN